MPRKPVSDGGQWVIAELSPKRLVDGTDVIRSYVGPNGPVMDPKKALRFGTYEAAAGKIHEG